MSSSYDTIISQLDIKARVFQQVQRPHISPGAQKTYGPYYQWTYKREAKTVTVNLTATQAKVYQRAIDEHRKLEMLLEDIRTTSLQILEATTPGVIKRKQPK